MSVKQRNKRKTRPPERARTSRTRRRESLCCEADEATASLGQPGKYRAYDMANAKADVQRAYEELASAR